MQTKFDALYAIKSLRSTTCFFLRDIWSPCSVSVNGSGARVSADDLSLPVCAIRLLAGSYFQSVHFLFPSNLSTEHKYMVSILEKRIIGSAVPKF